MLFSFKVMGQVYAQPLIATQVPEILVNARGTMERDRNVAIVATMENFVYAFDADGGNKDAERCAATLLERALWATRCP